MTKAEAIARIKDHIAVHKYLERGAIHIIEALNMAIKALEREQWIPVSERLPEEKKDVLIAFKHNMVVGFWEDILDNGEPAWYANSGDGWMTSTTAVDSDGIPIAWMPLPTAYKEGGQE